MTLPRDADPAQAAIYVRIADVLAELPAVPIWRDAWTRLGPETTNEERLAVYRAIRDSGVLPPEAGFYLVSWQADVIASERAETELLDMDEQLKRIEERHGRDVDGNWPSEEVPAEYEEFLDENHVAWEGVLRQTLTEFGEHDMARLFESDREAFEERTEAGRRYFHGEPDPEWLEDFVEGIAACAKADQAMGTLAVRHHEEHGMCEVLVYPKPVELVGGAADGAVVWPAFSVDIRGLQALFERVDDLSWNTHGFHGTEPPFLSVEGVYAGREVWLQVAAEAPDDEEPPLRLKVNPRRPAERPDDEPERESE